MKRFLYLLTTLACLVSLTACHSNEANYKAAYDRAMQKHRDGIDAEQFDKIQAEARRLTTVIGGDSVRLIRLFANVVLDSADVARRYSVVIAVFKQQFNAKTMRDRLRQEEGLESYVLFGGTERKYYVIARGFDESQPAARFIKEIDRHVKMPVLEPIPWILEKL